MSLEYLLHLNLTAYATLFFHMLQYLCNYYVYSHPLGKSAALHFQVAGAYSKTWCYRVDALLSVYKKLLEVSPTTPKEELRNMIRAAIFLVKKALLDKVTSVSHLLKRN